MRNKQTGRTCGRPPETPETARGRALLAAIEATGLGMQDAAKKCGVHYATFRRLIYGNPDRAAVGVVVRVCRKLAIPLHVVAPSLGQLVA